MAYLNGKRILNVEFTGITNVDQTFNPESENPQSGIAVAEAIRNPILNHITYEIAEDGTVDIVSCDRAIKGDYIIPDTIEGCPVTSIGKSFSPVSKWAFQGCENLTSIIIPDSVTLIGDNAFNSCYNLEKIVMGSGTVTIGSGAFYDCFALKEIIISENITTIGVGAFENVDNMADVYYNGTSEQWNEIIVEDRNEPLVNATIHFNYNSTPATKGYINEALRDAIDQTYSPESENAQSGFAVAGAIATVGEKWVPLVNEALTENLATEFRVVFDKPYKKIRFKIMFYSSEGNEIILKDVRFKRAKADGGNSAYAARNYLVYGTGGNLKTRRYVWGTACFDLDNYIIIKDGGIATQDRGFSSNGGTTVQGDGVYDAEQQNFPEFYFYLGGSIAEDGTLSGNVIGAGTKIRVWGCE